MYVECYLIAKQVHYIPDMPEWTLVFVASPSDYIDDFIAYNNRKYTIVALNTGKDHGNSVRYCLQQPGKNAQQIKNILVVDDEYDINLTLECILNQSGFKVYSFTDPLIALESVRPGLYDLAILDVKMPVMNGFGLYNEIRKVDDKIKVCFLTAATDVYYELFRKEAFAHFEENFIIRKPIENELLLEKIGSIMDSP
jgi:CheY-like chemotaxis protein